MANDRDPQQADYYNRSETQDYGRDYGSGRQYSSTSAREYQAAGQNIDRGGGGQRYGSNDRGQGYGDRNQGYGNADRGQPQGGEYRGSYGSDGRRFEADYAGDQNRDRDQDRSRDQNRAYGRQPQGYQYEERGFAARAGDEVRSWFGDDEASRRRDMDARYDERQDRQQGNYGHRDSDYHQWRRGQIDALDRDYDEYRRENQQKFHNEFSSWRTDRQGQRDALGKVKEHMEVVGSDGEHVGTVDKVRGDHVILTKNDQDAGGRHHWIPSRWIQTVDDKVMLRKSAAEAKQEWHDAERSGAMFGEQDSGQNKDQNDASSQARDNQGRMLNRSFSGTY